LDQVESITRTGTTLKIPEFGTILRAMESAVQTRQITRCSDHFQEIFVSLSKMPTNSSFHFIRMSQTARNSPTSPTTVTEYRLCQWATVYQRSPKRIKLLINSLNNLIVKIGMPKANYQGPIVENLGVVVMPSNAEPASRITDWVNAIYAFSQPSRRTSRSL
jgi:hypothetical protein